MIRRKIARNIGYPIYDLATGTKILDVLEFLDESQWWTSEKIEKLQLFKLKKLIKHCNRNVPYYHYLFKKNNFNSEKIKKVEDIEKIPILTKEILKHQGSSMYSKISKKRSISYCTTGGTTGAPVEMIKDLTSKTWVWASFYRFFNWMNFKIGEPRVVLWPIWGRIVSNQIKKQIVRNIFNCVRNDYYIDTFSLSPDKIQCHIKKIMLVKPVNIHGFATAVYNLALMIEKYGKTDIRPKSISTTAEVLHDFHRKKFEEVFGCKTFNQYGCGEANGIAYECNAHEGLHINSEHAILEVLKNGSNIIKGSGKVIITDLDNYAMPILRFQNDDICTLSNKKCSCGREYPLIKNVEGRIGDTIFSSKGLALHPEFFTHLLNECNFYEKYTIIKYQVVQENKNELIWNMVLNINLKKNDEGTLKKYIKKYLPNMHITFNMVDDIPNERSGKFQYVKSKIE